MNFGGTITKSYASNEKSVQNKIDSAIASATNNVTQIYTADTYNDDDEKYDVVGSSTLFSSNPHYIGGIVGLNLAGRIDNSYNKVMVSNVQSMYAGGIVGATVGA